MMDAEDRHREIMNKLHEMHQHNLDAHGSLLASLLNMRNNTWHQFKLIHDRLMDFISWGKKE